MKKAKTLLVASAIAATAMTPAFAGNPMPAEDEVMVMPAERGSSLSPTVMILLLLAAGGAAYALSQSNGNNTMN